MPGRWVARNMVVRQHRGRGRKVRLGVQKNYDKWTQSDVPRLSETMSNMADTTTSNKQQTSLAGFSVANRTGEQAKEASEVLKVIVNEGLNGVWPPDAAKQYKVCVRLVGMGVDRTKVRRACHGMRRLFPWSGGKPFDAFKLEQKLAEALAEAPKADLAKIEDRLDAENKRKEKRLRAGPLISPQEGLTHIRKALK